MDVLPKVRRSLGGGDRCVTGAVAERRGDLATTTKPGSYSAIADLSVGALTIAERKGALPTATGQNFHRRGAIATVSEDPTSVSPSRRAVIGNDNGDGVSSSPVPIFDATSTTGYTSEHYAGDKGRAAIE